MAADLHTVPFRGERLRDLAEMEGLSMRDLAAALGTTQNRISKIVNTRSRLTPEIIEAATTTYGVPAAFFSVVPAQQDQAAITFRKRASSSIRADKRITRLFREAARLWRTASESSGFRTVDMSGLRELVRDNRVEDVAVALRKEDGLGSEDPIPNMVRFTERRGVGVILGLDPLLSQRPTNECNDLGDKDYSGVSSPSRFEDRPLVTTVAPQPGAVTRMTIGHELGHIIFDPDLQVSPRAREIEEKRAYSFASALLLPESMMRRRVYEDMTLNSYLRIKADYGASVSAIVVRAQRLGVISSQRARSLHIQISSRGWRDNEPVPVSDEHPTLLHQATQRAWPVNTIRAAAEDVGVKHSLVSAWTETKQPAVTAVGETNTNVVSLTERLASRRRDSPSRSASVCSGGWVL